MALCERLRVLRCLLLSTAVPSSAAVRCGAWCVLCVAVRVHKLTDASTHNTRAGAGTARRQYIRRARNSRGHEQGAQAARPRSHQIKGVPVPANKFRA
jgi:ribonuclease PH